MIGGVVAKIGDWGSTELFLVFFNIVALYIGFHFLFTRVRKKMRTVEEIHRNKAGSRSLIQSSFFDESE